MTGATNLRCCWIGLFLTLQGIFGIYFTKPAYNFCVDIRLQVVVGRIQTLQNASHLCNDVRFHTVNINSPLSVVFSVNSSGWVHVQSVALNSSIPNENTHSLEVSVSCGGEFSGKVPVIIQPKNQCSCAVPHSNSTAWISKVCFQAEELHFIVEENTKSVRLGNVASCEFGHGFNRTYTIKADSLSDKFEVDGASSEVFLLSAFDREVEDEVSFTLECSVSKDGQPVGQSVAADIRITVGDTNDNPILFQNNMDKSVIESNTENQWYSVTLNDRDLFGCEHHRTQVSLDPRGACSQSAIDMGHHVGSGPLGHVVCRLRVHVEREKIDDSDDYTCVISITDPGFKPSGAANYSNVSTLTVNIKMDRTTSSPPSEVYMANVVEGAARLTRIHTFGKLGKDTPRSYFSNRLASAFAVTRYEGIVYVDKPSLLEGSRQQNFTVSAYSKDAQGEQKIVLIVKITSGPKKKTICNESCARHGGRDGCVTSCGLGLLARTCIWRMGEKGIWTTKYGTCTYNKLLCPNNICDELENQNPQLCPQDCTNRTVGTAKLNTHPPRGIAQAVGNCFCSYTGECACTAADLSPRITPKPRDSILIKSTQLENGVNADNTTDQDHDVTNGQLYYRPKGDGGGTSDGGCDDNCRTTTAATLGCLGAVTCIFVLGWRLRKRRCQNSQNIKKRVGSLVSVSAIPSDYHDDRDIHRNYHPTPQFNNKGPLDYTPTPEDMKWEFERDKLTLDKTLGEGEFGRVVKARSYSSDGKDSYKEVAVKMLKHCASSSELSDLLSEFNLLKDVNHPNVIRLLGACTRDGPFYVIVEYCEYGSLLCFLRRSRLEENGYVNHRYRHKEFSHHCENGEYMEPELLSIGNLLSFAWQIAKGMKYLSEIKLVHRDLAARNVLVAAGKVLKISDFGLTRDVYEADTYLKQSKGRIPVKWLAPESLYAQVYTTQSDVWSFGIVLWEIVTLGAPPYPGIPPERLYNLLIAGYRMDRPESCTDEMYAVMQKCWKTDPTERPPFFQLTDIFDRLLQQRTEYLDLTGGLDDTTPDVYDKCFGSALGKVFPKQNQPRLADRYGSISVISGNSEPYLTPSTSKLPVDSSDNITTQNMDKRVVLHSNGEDSSRLSSRKCLDLNDKSPGGEKLALLLDSGTAVFSPSSDTDDDPDSRETDALSVQRC